MNIQFESLTKIKSILNLVFPKSDFNKFNLNKSNSQDLVSYLIFLTDALLKAENLYHKRNLMQVNGDSIIQQNLIPVMNHIGIHLNQFNTRIFDFSKTERQTFIFIIDNLIDYHKNLEFFSDKKGKKDIYSEYKFWIENFFKIFDQKINGSFERKTHSGESGGYELFFTNAEIRLPLSPFIIGEQKTWFLLQGITEEKLLYRDIQQDKSIVVENELLDTKLVEFFISNLDFKNLKSISGRSADQQNIYLVYADVIENIVNSYRKKLYGVCLNLFKELEIDKLNLPLLYVIKIKSLLKLDRIFDTKRLLQKFILLYPYYSTGYKILGDVYLKEENHELAHNSYVKALNITQNKKLTEKLKAIKEEIEKGKRKTESSRGDMFYDITEMILEHKEAIISREREFRQMVEVLISQSRSNLILIGDSGVGKTALIRFLAQKILDGKVPSVLREKKIKEINFVALLTGSKYRGQFEEKALKILNDFKFQNAILILEDIHLMMSSGTTRGTSLDLVNILKQFLREQSIQVIATTSYDEYKNTVEKDNSLLGFFQKLTVNELSTDDTRVILGNLAKAVLERENICVPEDIITDIVESAKRNIKEKKLPDGAIMILDRAVSKLKLKNSLEAVQRSELIQADILEVLSDILNLPETNISVTLKSRLSGLKQYMESNIVGQTRAIDRIVSSVLTSKLNLDIKNSRPDGVFLFIGPTGVGKTEMAIALAKALFGSEDYLIRIDMSEYMEKFTYSRFIGAAPGYVGYYDTNQLTDKIRQNPFSVILLDEFEKADIQLLNIFLQVFDAGRLTDARGNVVDFSHSTIIMTSNIGTSLFSKTQMGYQSDLDGNRVSRGALVKSLKRFFSPEFLNRIDEIVVFNHLEAEDIKKIIEIQLGEVKHNIEKQGKELVIQEEVFDFIIQKYYSKEYGARNISRALKTEILEKIAGYSLTSEWNETGVIICAMNNQQVDIQLEVAGTASIGKEVLLEKFDGK